MKWFWAIVFPYTAALILREIVYLVTDLQPVSEFKIFVALAVLFVLLIQSSASAIKNVRRDNHEN